MSYAVNFGYFAMQAESQGKLQVRLTQLNIIPRLDLNKSVCLAVQAEIGSLWPR